MAKKTLNFDQWLSVNHSEIDIELAESGADREMDFDSEKEYLDRYNEYLDNIVREGGPRRSARIDLYPIDQLSSMMKGAIEKMHADIIQKKEFVILSALRKNGININLQEALKKRFSPIQREVLGGHSETYYYNDGSDGGLRLVTFNIGNKAINPQFDNSREISFKVELSYY